MLETRAGSATFDPGPFVVSLYKRKRWYKFSKFIKNHMLTRIGNIKRRSTKDKVASQMAQEQLMIYEGY